MTGSADFAEAVVELGRRYSAMEWVEPRGTRERRAQLEAAISESDVSVVAPFDYDTSGVDAYLAALVDVRRAARALDHVLRPLGVAHVEALAARAAAIRSGDDERYTEVVAGLDGLPSADLVREAEAILAAEPPDAGAATVSDVAAADAFREALVRLGLDDWVVEISERMSALVSVSAFRKRLRVRRGSRFSPAALRRLVVHEVGGHVLRWKHSVEQPEPVAVVPIGRTTPTEEGLALWGESRHGLLDRRVLRTYAARVVAVDAARTSGILDVARRIAPFVGAELAAQTAMRAKRGLRDPNGPGGSTKDWSYLGGLRLCEDLARRSPDDLSLLLGVKWGAESLPTARALVADGRLRPVPLPPLPAVAAEIRPAAS